jgi:hypothetical protein
MPTVAESLNFQRASRGCLCGDAGPMATISGPVSSGIHGCVYRSIWEGWPLRNGLVLCNEIVMQSDVSGPAYRFDIFSPPRRIPIEIREF